MNYHKQFFRATILTAGMGLLILPVSAQSSSSSKSKSQNTTASQTQTSTSNSASSKISAADRHFLDKAAEGNKAEVELGQLASEKASSNDVKQFGQRMVKDHSKANDDLQKLASEKGVPLPDKVSAKDQAAKNRLEKLSGKQFDEAYMRDMVRDHTQDVNEFRQESTTAKDPDVKSFAKDTLSTLQKHLKQAKQIEPKTMTSTSKTNSKTSASNRFSY